MPGTLKPVLTGGCQCGGVRYALHSVPPEPSICHCRMCQKAVGGPFAVICPVPKSAFHVVRGAIAWFRSSALAPRGFCRDCGTPLAYDNPDSDWIALTSGSLDHPELAPPVNQDGIEGRLPWADAVPHLPGRTSEDDDPDGTLLPRIRASNRQHPDHDTEAWPPR